MNHNFLPQEEKQGVSVIIVNMHGKETIERLLSGFLSNNTYNPVEIIIVDGNSKEDILSIVLEYSKELFIRFVGHQKNFAFAECNNLAVKKSRYSYLLFFDDEIIYDADVLPLAVEAISVKSVDIVAVRKDCNKNPIFSNQGRDIEKDNIEIINNIEADGKRGKAHKNKLTSDMSLNRCESANDFMCKFLLMRRADFYSSGGFLEFNDFIVQKNTQFIFLGDKIKNKCYLDSEIYARGVN